MTSPTAPLQKLPTQADKLPKTELHPTHESDDRDIEYRDTKLDHTRGVPLDSLIETADPDYVMDPSKMDFERFMNQMITVHVHESSSPEDSDFAEVTVNGRYIAIVRGETSDIPRAHAEVLARAKALRVVQKRVTLADGSMGYEERAVLKHMYPFSVIHDPAGRRGADWIKQLFRNPN